MRRVRRRWLAAGAAALACTPLAPGGPAAADVPTIAAMQAQVVAAAHRPAIDGATRALGADQAALATAEARQGAERAATARAAADVAAETTTVATDTADLQAATAAVAAGTAAVADDRRRLAGIAVGLYVDPALSHLPAAAGAVASAQRRAEDIALVEVVTGAEEHRYEADRASLLAAHRLATGDAARLSGDRATLVRATRLRDDRAAVLGADTDAVGRAAGAAAADQAALAAAQASLAAGLAAVAGPAGVPDDGTPSIMGASALDAAQLAAWYRGRGGVDLTSAPIEQLAAWYLAEGAAQGVRGDVAFAQAMVETGGFTSPDAVQLNNYAGIGHCDSCAAGLAFPSPELGVRGQIQLLASFASPTLTSATLAEPLVLAALAPQDQPDKGCCRTWQELTGTWATDPIYGRTVMAMYRSILTSAISPAG